MTNREKARKYFGLTPGDGLILHHVDITLRYTNRKKYDEWNPEDLIVVTKAEHNRIHSKGIKLTEEHKKKIAKAHVGKPVWNKGKKLTQQHIQNRTKSCQKPVEQYTLNGQLIKVWVSAKAAEVEGFNQGNIVKVCKGKFKQHKGYVWKYANK